MRFLHFFWETFFSQGPKKLFYVKYYHFKYLGGALDIALHARKKIMIIRGLNQKLSSKTSGGEQRRFWVVPPPFWRESYLYFSWKYNLSLSVGVSKIIWIYYAGDHINEFLSLHHHKQTKKKMKKIPTKCDFSLTKTGVKCKKSGSISPSKFKL